MDSRYIHTQYCTSKYWYLQTYRHLRLDPIVDKRDRILRCCKCFVSGMHGSFPPLRGLFFPIPAHQLTRAAVGWVLLHAVLLPRVFPMSARCYMAWIHYHQVDAIMTGPSLAIFPSTDSTFRPLPAPKSRVDGWWDTVIASSPSS
jgi:hypothetical protein